MTNPNEVSQDAQTLLNLILEAMHNPADGDDLIDKLEALRPAINAYEQSRTSATSDAARLDSSERSSYRDSNDMPTERAVLEREWRQMRLALSLPKSTSTALEQARKVLRSLSFKDNLITSALESIDAAIAAGGSQNA